MMNKGDLVKCKGEMGVVLAVGSRGEKARIMMGDGLTVEEAQADCEVVRFSESTVIPANFIELVEAYEVSRAPKEKISHAFARPCDFHCM